MAASDKPYPMEEAVFGICPSKFFDEVIKISEEFINDAVTCLEEELAKELSDKELQMYRSTFEKVENKLHRTLDHNVDKAEMYSMRNIFHVPSQVYPAWCAKQAGDDAAMDWSDSVETTDASLRATAKVTREEEEELTLKLKEARRAVRLGRREKAANTEQLAKRQKLNAALTKDVATASAATVAVMKKRGFYPLADKVNQLKEREAEAVELTSRAQALLERAGGAGGKGGGSSTAPTPRAAHKGAKRAIATQSIDDVNKLTGRLAS